MILLDTHAAIWLITDDTRLGPKSRAIIEAAVEDEALFVSAITFWEIAFLATRRRVRSTRSPAEQRIRILDAGVQELPITGEIAIRAVELNNLPDDPADRFIMATAINRAATLVTADDALLNWQHSVRRVDASK